MYDGKNQLIRENNQAAERSYTYEYDNSGNILSYTAYPYSGQELGAPIASESNTYAYNDANWGDKLTSCNNETVSYDLSGNMTCISDLPDGKMENRPVHFYWSKSRRLDSLTDKYEFTANYKYDENGLRIEKCYNYRDDENTFYTYSNGKLSSQINKDGLIMYFRYDKNGEIFGLTYNNIEYYYIKNPQNDVTAIVDKNGNTVASYAYNAWERVIYVHLKKFFGNNKQVEKIYIITR